MACLFLPLRLQAAGETLQLDVAGMARGFLPNPWSVEATAWGSNPGLLDPGSEWHAEVAAIRLYNLRQLTVSQVAAGKGFGRLGAGLKISSFGWEAYREMAATAVFSFGKPRLRCGFSLTFCRSVFRRYGSRDDLGLGFGCLISPLSDLSIALASSDVLPRGDGMLARQSVALVSWRWAEVVTLSVALLKQPEFPAEWRSGVEYRPFQSLTLRAGVTGAPERLTFGFGFRAGPVRVNYSYAGHPALGSTQGVSLEFQASH